MNGPGGSGVAGPGAYSRRVNPGDIIVGDADGLVVLPSSRAAEITDVAVAIGDAEESIRAATEAGSRLDEARRAVGYHSLQARAPHA